MKSRLRALGALLPAERWTLCQAWLLLLGVDVALRALSLQRVQDWAAARRSPEPGAEDADAWAAIERLHRLVGIASRHHLYRMNCLQRSLALQRLLDRRGIGSALRIGVRKDEGILRAHAWLEVGGRPVGEADPCAPEFLPLERPG